MSRVRVPSHQGPARRGPSARRQQGASVTETSPRALRNFVNGEYREASAETHSDVVNPATGQVVASAPVSDQADVDAAYAAAATAFESWRDTTPGERQRMMLKFADAVETRADDFIRLEPIGVVGQVTPWNYPMMMAVWKIAPALAAGDTIVLKPSDTTPETTLLLAEVAAEFLPPGVLNVITGDRDTGRMLVEHQTPQLVAITGSVHAGMQVAE